MHHPVPPDVVYVVFRAPSAAPVDKASHFLTVSPAGEPVSQTSARAIRRVFLVTLGLNVAVALAKVGYGTWANVLAIRADGFHSLVDASNNIVGLIALTVAGRPADRGHPYGHQKFEVAAAAVIGVSLLAMAVDLLRDAIARLGDGAESAPRIGPLAFVVLLGTLVVNYGVARYERRQAEKLKSPILSADAAHTASDMLVTVAVLLSSVCVALGYTFADVAATIGVCGFILWTGVGVLRRTVGYLADAAMLDADEILRAAVAVPGVISAHKARTRGTPNAVYVDLHIQVDRHLGIVQAHELTHRVIDCIKQRFPEVVDVVIHTEPAQGARLPPRHSG